MSYKNDRDSCPVLSSLPLSMVEPKSSPPALPLIPIAHWAQEMLSSAELRAGRLRSVHLFRTKRPPFNHEFLVASFRQDSDSKGPEPETSWVKMERAPRRDKGGSTFTADSFAPITRDVVSKNTVSVSRDLSRLAPNSNELGSIHFNTPESTLHPVYFRSVLRQMMTMSYSQFSYNLFTANCRWFARTGLDTIIQFSRILDITFAAKWEGASVSVDQFQKKIESERFGGRELRKLSKEALNWTGRTTLLAQTTTRDDLNRGIFPSPEAYTPLLDNVKELKEGTVIFGLKSEADILNKRAFSYLIAGDHANALLDAKQAIRLLEPHLSSDPEVTRRLGVAYYLQSSIKALQNQLDEAIADGKRGISLLQSIDHERLANYHLALAGIYQQAGRLDEAILSCDEGLYACVPTQQTFSELAWKWYTKDRFSLLKLLSSILEQRGKGDDLRQALMTSLECVALWKDLHAWGDPLAVVSLELQLFSDCTRFATSLEDWDQAVKSHELLIERLKTLPQYAEQLADAFERHTHLVALAQDSSPDGSKESEGGLQDFYPILMGFLTAFASPERIFRFPWTDDPLRDVNLEGFKGNAVEVARKECDSLWEKWEEDPSDFQVINQLRFALSFHVKLLKLSHNNEDMLDPLYKRITVSRVITSMDDQHTGELVILLRSLSEVYVSLARLPEAITIDEEQVSILREWAAASYDGDAVEPFKFKKNLLRSNLIKHAKTLYERGHHVEGSQVLLEAKAVHLDIVGHLPNGEQDPDAVLEGLVQYSTVILTEEGRGREIRDICSLVVDITKLQPRAEDRILQCFALCLQARAELICGNPRDAAWCGREALEIFPFLGFGTSSYEERQLMGWFRLRMAEVLALPGGYHQAYDYAIEAVNILERVWKEDLDDLDKALDLHNALVVSFTIATHTEPLGKVIAVLKSSDDVIRDVGSRFKDLDVTSASAEGLVQLAMYQVLDGDTDAAIALTKEFVRIYIGRALSSSDTSKQEELKDAVRRFGMVVELLELGGKATPRALQNMKGVHAGYLAELRHVRQ